MKSEPGRADGGLSEVERHHERERTARDDLPKADQAAPVVGILLDRTCGRWDRMLWGVHFTGANKDDSPMLIGDLWATDLGHSTYPGEPTRALLFCTRAQARAWCVETLLKWRNGRQCDSSVRRWMVKPVCVRETEIGRASCRERV